MFLYFRNATRCPLASPLHKPLTAFDNFLVISFDLAISVAFKVHCKYVNFILQFGTTIYIKHVYDIEYLPYWKQEIFESDPHT